MRLPDLDGVARRRALAGGRAAWWLLILPLIALPLFLFAFPGESDQPDEGLSDPAAARNAARPRQPDVAGPNSVLRTDEPSSTEPGGGATGPRPGQTWHPEGTPDVEFPCGITGRVVDPAGRALPGARVLAFEYWPLIHYGQSYTDAQGRFVLDRLPMDESLAVHVSAAGRAPSLIDEVVITAGLLSPLGQIVLSEGATLAGTVRSRTNREPLPGARVAVLAWIEGGELPVPDLETTCDGRGRFTFDAAPAGACCLRVEARGHAPTRTDPIALVAGEQHADVEILLGPTKSLAGHVRDPEGGAVAGATILFWPQDGRGLETRTESGPSGEFRVELDPECSECRVTCQHPDFLRYRQVRNIRTEDLDITLAKGGVLEVRLLGKGPETAPRWYLERGREQPGAGRPRTFHIMRTEPGRFQPLGQRRFACRSLEPGWYRVRAVVDDHWSAVSQPVAIEREAAATSTDLELDERFFLDGKVLGPGEAAVPGALVSLSMGPAEYQVRTSPEGTFRTCAFGGEGTLIVRIERRGQSPLEDIVVLGREPLQQVFRLEAGGRIHGRVTVAGDLPASPVLVWLRSGAEDLERSTITDSEGLYEFTGLVLEETYNLYPLIKLQSSRTSLSSFRHPVDDDDRFAFDEDYEFEVELTEMQPEVLQNLNLPREPRARVRGIVRDLDGPRAGITIVAGEYETNFESRVLTGPAGEFEFEVPVGDVEVDVLNASGLVLWTTDLEIAESELRELDIFLRTVALEGLVQTPRGEVVPGASVKVLFRGSLQDDEFAPGSFARQLQTDSEGRFRAVDLIEGTYRVEAWAPALARGHVDGIEVRTGGSPPLVRLQLGDPAPLELQITDSDGKPLQHATIQCFDEQKQLVPLRNAAHARLVRGRVRIDNLPAGLLRVVVRAGREKEEREIQLTANTLNRISWQVSFREPTARVPGRR